MGALEIIILIGVIILFGFTVTILLDKGFFKRKIEKVEIGMTGEQIQNDVGLKVIPVEIYDTGYIAVVRSWTKIFKYHFEFENGVLVRKLPF